MRLVHTGGGSRLNDSVVHHHADEFYALSGTSHLQVRTVAKDIDNEERDLAYDCRFDTDRTASGGPPLTVQRSLTGHGQERGGFRTIFTNPSKDENIELVYLESLLWSIKPFLHTLKATITDKDGTRYDSNSVIKQVYYRPAIDRKRGTHMELRLTVPPAAVVVMTWDLEKSILRYDEYPPDANRGFDLAYLPIHL